MQEYTAQPASRYTLTAAIWDDHTVSLEAYEMALNVDYVEFEGELRSDKAPLQPLLAVPFYALGRAVGVEPATHLRVDGNLGLWWITFWSSVVPFGIVLVIMRRVAVHVDRRDALVATLGLGFGTLVLPYASELYGHLLAAACLFGGWLVVRAPRPRAPRLIAGGLLVGSAAAVEYQTALVGLVIAVAVAIGVRWRVLWCAAGAALPLLVVAGYQWIAFDDPTTIPYSLKENHQSGIVGISLPSPGHILSIFGGLRGLVFAGPVILVALAGAFHPAVRSRTELRRDLVVGVLAFVALVCVQAGGSEPPYGGESVGPRYLIPAIPFLVVPLAAVWRRLRLIAGFASIVGALTMLLGLATLHLVPHGNTALGTYLRRIGDGDLAPTVFTLATGWIGWVLYAALVAAVGYALLHIARIDLEASAFEEEALHVLPGDARLDRN